MEALRILLNKIIVTGSSGFIGMHLCKSLLEDGYDVVGVDSMNDYYDVSLKEARLKILHEFQNFIFENVNISNFKKTEKLFKKYKPEKVVNLAAQAGVRYSLENPHVYIESNVVGFMNILECCRNHNVKGLIYASSSSVYGKNNQYPFSTNDKTESPISIYAATKKSNELMAHSYSHLYKINTTGLRFFTVYGPWGRPDMAMYIFAKKIIEGVKIPVFNNGNMFRDFTFIDDIIKGVKASIENNYRCEIFNLGNNNSAPLLEVIGLIETALNKKAKIEYLDMQAGDVKKTYASIDRSIKKLNYFPTIDIKTGIPRFIDWYMRYHTNDND